MKTTHRHDRHELTRPDDWYCVRLEVFVSLPGDVVRGSGAPIALDCVFHRICATLKERRKVMATITVDDKIYAQLRQRAAAAGFTVEDWLAHTAGLTERGSSHIPEKSGLDELFALVERQGMRSEGGLDWSRDAIYE
jgi:hypothetical protein